MNYPFPLVQIPKRVVYVDDQGRFLDILRKTMPKQLSREFIDSPEGAIQALSQEVAHWRGTERLLAGAREARENRGEAKHYIDSYFTDWRRFHLTGVLIVDYAMPGMNGLDLVRRLEACPSRRVLLTGEADELVAIQAFNEGLIQQFIPKSSPSLLEDIRRCYENMHVGVCEHLGHLVRPTLSATQVELLQNPAVREGLHRKIFDDLMWMEYVIVGEPFGVLGMSRDGPLQWLQLETESSLKALAEAMEETGKRSAVEIGYVRNGHAVPVDELMMQLELRTEEGGDLVDLDEVCARPLLYGGVVDLPFPVLTAKRYGVDDIMTAAELMRSLIRDAKLAFDSRAKDPDAYADALGNVSETAAFSKFHKETLDGVLREMELDSTLATDLQRRIAGQQ